MSFFEDDDQPTAVGPRPRRAEPLRGDEPDPQTLLVRRGIAAGAALLVLILVVVGINSCLDSRRERALKDYNREVGALVRESDEQVAQPLFELLASGSGAQALDLQTQVNQLRVIASNLVGRAEKLDVPDDTAQAQTNLVTALELRRDGIADVADGLPSALGEEGAEDAVEAIAAQMQAFLASDVLYSQRVIPLIDRALKDAGVGRQQIETSSFLPNLDWLRPNYVGDRLGAEVGRTGADGEPAPGTHGHGLVSVGVGTTTLQAGSPNRIPASADLAFTVKFQNQGENNEADVIVRIRITGSGKPVSVREKIDQTTAGQETTVTVPLGQAPPIGTPVTVVVTVEGVPGEKKTDNNTQRYPAIFTR